MSDIVAAIQRRLARPKERSPNDPIQKPPTTEAHKQTENKRESEGQRHETKPSRPGSGSCPECEGGNTHGPQLPTSPQEERTQQRPPVRPQTDQTTASNSNQNRPSTTPQTPSQPPIIVKYCLHCFESHPAANKPNGGMLDFDGGSVIKNMKAHLKNKGIDWQSVNMDTDNEGEKWGGRIDISVGGKVIYSSNRSSPIGKYDDNNRKTTLQDSQFLIKQILEAENKQRTSQ